MTDAEGRQRGKESMGRIERIGRYVAVEGQRFGTTRGAYVTGPTGEPGRYGVLAYVWTYEDAVRLARRLEGRS